MGTAACNSLAAGGAGGMPTCSHKYKAADSGAGCSCRTPPVSCRRTGRRSACSPCACRRPCRRSGASSTDRSCSTRRTASPGTSDSYTRRSVGSAHTSGRSGGSWSSGQPLSSPPTLLSSAPWLTSEVTHIGVKLLQRIILRLLTVCLNIWKPSPQVYQYNVFKWRRNVAIFSAYLTLEGNIFQRRDAAAEKAQVPILTLTLYPPCPDNWEMFLLLNQDILCVALF